MRQVPHTRQITVVEPRPPAYKDRGRLDRRSGEPAATTGEDQVCPHGSKRAVRLGRVTVQPRPFGVQAHAVKTSKWVVLDDQVGGVAPCSRTLEFSLVPVQGRIGELNLG